MYFVEKNYCTIGAVLTIPLLIFGPVAIIILWIFVGMFCLNYKTQINKSVQRQGLKAFGVNPFGNPDYYVWLNGVLKHNPSFRRQFWNDLTPENKVRYEWLKKYDSSLQ